ncbi:uncharacterized protein LOC128198739 [Bicyclus anynana]|uniref:Uncharacterized protein LOC128198739 n=1 Tax=Bicyclus anynana TaxID=110368 RepID=A0ABM3LQX6_BICAN|nr:uncharacterized protein LOC128198739 [Bicyclus anynana]
MFKESAKYVSDIAVAVDNKTVEANLATLGVRPVQLTWKTKCPGEFCAGSIVVENVTVHGLDTLYSSHSGGPCQLQSTRIAEALRFHSLMVRGSANFKNVITEGNHDFVTEIHDVAVNFEVNLEKPETKFEFVSWRSLEISILELDQHKRTGRVLNAFIHGYLENELPILLSTHLSNIYKQLTVAKPENVLPATNCDCGTERQ